MIKIIFSILIFLVAGCTVYKSNTQCSLYNNNWGQCEQSSACFFKPKETTCQKDNEQSAECHRSCTRGKSGGCTTNYAACFPVVSDDGKTVVGCKSADNQDRCVLRDEIIRPSEKCQIQEGKGFCDGCKKVPEGTCHHRDSCLFNFCLRGNLG